MQAPASVRRAFRAANPGAGTASLRHGAAAGPPGPRAAVKRLKAIGAGRPCPRRENEVFHMATIKKIRTKLERTSALNGWRMRWHMQ
jgi:hypothetical protein